MTTPCAAKFVESAIASDLREAARCGNSGVLIVLVARQWLGQENVCELWQQDVDGINAQRLAMGDTLFRVVILHLTKENRVPNNQPTFQRFYPIFDPAVCDPYDFNPALRAPWIRVVDVRDEKLMTVTDRGETYCFTTGCESLAPAAQVYLDEVQKYKDDLGSYPSLILVLASEVISNLYEEPGTLGLEVADFETTYSVQAMGLHDQTALSLQFATPENKGIGFVAGVANVHVGDLGQPVITQLYNRSGLLQALQKTRDDYGSTFEVLEYGLSDDVNLNVSALSTEQRFYLALRQQMQYGKAVIGV